MNEALDIPILLKYDPFVSESRFPIYLDTCKPALPPPTLPSYIMPPLQLWRSTVVSEIFIFEIKVHFQGQSS